MDEDAIYLRFKLIRKENGASSVDPDASGDLWIAQSLDNIPGRDMKGNGVCGEYAIIDLLEQWVELAKTGVIPENTPEKLPFDP